MNVAPITWLGRRVGDDEMWLDDVLLPQSQINALEEMGTSAVDYWIDRVCWLEFVDGWSRARAELEAFDRTVAKIKGGRQLALIK